jgi:hypothetical protein
VSFFLQGVWGKSLWHQKVLISNLGLTVFVKHQVNWLSRFCSLSSGKEKKKKKKKPVKRQKPQVFSIFAPYRSKSLQKLSFYLFIKKHICLTEHIGGQIYFIRSPHPHLYRGPPSGHASPLGYFNRVIFKLQDFSW